MKKIVITGGHHSSALPVINELKKRFSGIEIFWFGHKYSAKGDWSPTLEFREITALGIPFFDLKAGKFYKTFDPIRLLKIPFGLIQAFFLLYKLRPDIILSFGGYLAVPTVLAGKILGIKSVTHEQTVVVGYANKLIAYFTNKILVSWEKSANFFKKGVVVHTGIPLREEIFKVTSSEFNVDNGLPTIYITGGKIGSHILNRAVSGCLYELLANYNIIHQAGDNTVFKDYDVLSAKYKNIPSEVKGRYFLKNFIFGNNIGEVFAKSQLIIARAGAHICSEIIALNKPTIFIPIPWVSHNEQYLNAKYVKDLGLAEILEEKQLTPEKLKHVIADMFSHLDSYKSKTPYILKNSASLIVDELQKTFQEKN